MDIKTKKIRAGVHLLFLGIILLSALHYWDIGQWKGYVRLFGGVEILAVIAAFILFAVGKTRMRTLKYVYILFGAIQVFPMLGAFGMVIVKPGYGMFHLLLMAWCAAALFFLSRKKRENLAV